VLSAADKLVLLELIALPLSGKLTAEGLGHGAQCLQILLLEGIAAGQIELASKRLCQFIFDKYDQVDQRHRIDAALAVNQDRVAALFELLGLGEGLVEGVDSAEDRRADRFGGYRRIAVRLDLVRFQDATPFR